MRVSTNSDKTSNLKIPCKYTGDVKRNLMACPYCGVKGEGTQLLGVRFVFPTHNEPTCEVGDLTPGNLWQANKRKGSNASLLSLPSLGQTSLTVVWVQMSRRNVARIWHSHNNA